MDAKTQEAINRLLEYHPKREREIFWLIQRCKEMYTALEKVADAEPEGHSDYPDSSAWEDNVAYARRIATYALMLDEPRPASASTDSAEADTESEVS